jgi:general secretion pathway protein B
VSFILDALKKSENERQRKAGPALYEVKLAPPRNRLPWWMVAVGVLLGINLIVVIWLLIRAPSAAKAPVAAAHVAQEPAHTSAAARSAPAASVPAPLPAREDPPAPSQIAGAPTLDGGLQYGPSAGSDDFAPAVEPTTDPNERVRTSTEAGLPSYQEAAAKNRRIPTLHLDFHLFAPKPQDRFVFINMKKMHEGDSMPEGVRVESINDEGAVLSFEGTRFTLLHE